MYDGIYILHTTGPEFRVAQSNSIDSIYKELDESGKYKPNVEAIINIFGQSEVFSSHELALNYAKQRRLEYNFLKDGICDIDSFREWVYNSSL